MVVSIKNNQRNSFGPEVAPYKHKKIIKFSIEDVEPPTQTAIVNGLKRYIKNETSPAPRTSAVKAVATCK